MSEIINEQVIELLNNIMSNEFKSNNSTLEKLKVTRHVLSEIYGDNSFIDYELLQRVLNSSF